jgi:hypothetical protein
MSYEIEGADGTKLYYGQFPGRKRPTLFLVKGSVYTAIGWFRNEGDMELFHETILRIFKDCNIRIERE